MMQDISSWTLTGLLQRQAEAHGEREFMSFEHGTSLSFASLHRDSDQLARNLASLGVAPGDRVMVMLKNRIEFMLAMFATMKVGAIFVPINTELKGAFLTHQMSNTEPRLLFLDHDLRDAFDAVKAGNESLATIIYVAGHVPKERPAVLAKAEAMTFENLSGLDGAKDDVLVTRKPQDIACIMYTSGTTGPSKGVLMPHAHCYLFGYGMARSMAMTKDDCQYVCMPLFHAMGLFLQVVSSLISGSKVFCIERFSPARWLDDVRACGATVTNALGVIPEFIFRTPETEYDRDHKMRTVMAVPIAAEWGDAMEKRFGFKFIQAYGMTEVNLPCYTNEDDPLSPGMAGHVLDDFFEVAIFNSETDAPLPQGEIGEIVVRPKVQFCFSQGYYRMPEETAEVFTDLGVGADACGSAGTRRFFRTGDIGRIDEDEFLYITGRKKEMIIVGGENVFPREIEEVLDQHDAVAASAVIGRPDNVRGEVPIAFVEVIEGGTFDAGALRNWCRDQLAGYKVPREIRLMDHLPRNSTGKILRRELKAGG